MNKIIIGLWLMMFAWVFFVALPAQANHIPLIEGVTYTDKVTDCKTGNLKNFISQISQITNATNEKIILENNECVLERQTFVIEHYICSFMVNLSSKPFSVVKLVSDDRIHKYVIVFAQPPIGWMECTDEILGEK